MITLPHEGAVVFASSWAVGAVLWAALVGLQTMRGRPARLLVQLRRTALVAGILTVLGVGAVVWVRPAWAGLGMVYGAGVVALAARWLARSLRQASEMGALEPPPAERRSRILGRAWRGLLGTSVLLAAVGVADLVWWRGWPAVFDFVVAGAVLVLGLAYRREARALA